MVQMTIYVSIIMVSIMTCFHIILTVIRHKLIVAIKIASLEVCKIGKIKDIIRNDIFHWSNKIHDSRNSILSDTS